MSQPIGLCVIGAGAIADRHLQAFEQIGGVRPEWVVSRTQEEAQTFATRFQFGHCGVSVEEALRDPAVQLALITSPSPSHSSQAVQALEMGKNAIVEIPVGLNWGEAKRVADTARATGRRVWVCHTMRSFPALREVRKRVRSGKLHISHISGFCCVARRRNQGMGGIGTRTWIDNLLWHHGCHQVDASLWILGMPELPRVQTLFGPNHPTLGMALDVGVQMTTSSGQLITHSLSYNVERGVWRMQFIADEDVLTFEDGSLTNEAGDVLVAGSAGVDLAVQNAEILASCWAESECEFDLAKVLPTMRTLERAQDSANSE